MNDLLFEQGLRQAMREETADVEAGPDLEWRLLNPATRSRQPVALALIGVAATIVAILVVLIASHRPSKHAMPIVRPEENAYKGAVSWSSVSFVDQRTGFALGEVPVCRRLVAPGTSCQPSDALLRVTRDGGQSWHTVTTSGLRFVQDGARIVAASPTRLYLQEYLQPELLTSGDGGRTWTPVDGNGAGFLGFGSPLTRSGSTQLLAVQGHTQAGVGCPPGIQRIDGTTRTTTTQPGSTPTADRGLAIGDDGSLWSAVAPQGCADAHSVGGTGQLEMFTSTDTAKTWQRVTDPPGNGFTSATTALDAQHAWTRDFRSSGTNAPGHDTVRFVRTSDGGRTWQALPLFAFDTGGAVGGSGYGTLLTPLNAKDLVLSTGAYLYASHDGGTSWRLATQGSRGTTRWIQVQRLSDTTALALGNDGVLRVTTDGARTWTVLSHVSRAQTPPAVPTEAGDPRDVQGERVTYLPPGFTASGPVQVEGPSEGVSTTTRDSTFTSPSSGLTLHVLVETGAHKVARKASPSQLQVPLPTGSGVESHGPQNSVIMTWATPKGNLLVVYVTSPTADASATSVVEAVAKGIVET